MALVILSNGMLSHSRVRTIHFRTLLALCTVLLLALTGIAFGVGYFLASDASRTESATVANAPQDDTVMLQKVGELAGRLAKLQSEALSLAHRIGTLKDFEHRLGAKATKPNPDKPAPAGGPMVPAFGASASNDAAPSALDSLEADIEELAANLATIDAATDAWNLSLMAYPARAPIPGADRSSRFGNREDPFTGRLAFHSGLDFVASVGEPILASAGGRVVAARSHSEYGLMLIIDHGNGLMTRYAHASRLYVREGDVVMPGQRIAAVGSTGRSTGPHLHFEVLEHGQFVNPDYFLAHAQ